MPMYKTARGLLESALKARLWDEIPAGKHKGQKPFCVEVTYGKGPLILIVGDNASGKSILRRVLQLRTQDFKAEAIALSMQARVGATSDFGVFRTVIYGDEQRDATGANSAMLVETGVKTAHKREKPHIVIWDEPEIGMAEGAAMGIGQAIGNFANEPGKHTVAIAVITHSRPLVRELLKASLKRPHFVHMRMNKRDKAYPTPEEWLDADVRLISPSEIRERNKRAYNRLLSLDNHLTRKKARETKEKEAGSRA